MQALVWTLRHTSTFGQSAVIDISLPFNLRPPTAFDSRAYPAPYFINYAKPPAAPVLEPDLKENYFTAVGARSRPEFDPSVDVA